MVRAQVLTTQRARGPLCREHRGGDKPGLPGGGRGVTSAPGAMAGQVTRRQQQPRRSTDVVHFS